MFQNVVYKMAAICLSLKVLALYVLWFLEISPVSMNSATKSPKRIQIMTARATFEFNPVRHD